MPFALNNAVVLVGGYDITNFTGQLDVGGSVNMLDAPHFGSKGHNIKIPGLKTYTAQFNGNADYGSATAVSRAFPLATVGDQHAVTVLPNVSGNPTAGDPAIFTRALRASMKSPGGAVGDVASFDLALESDTAMVDGIALQPVTARSSSSTGTICAFTGPTASQYLFAALHVGAVTGTTPTLDVKIQSAALVGFGSPSDRITFAQAGTSGAYTSQWATPVAGAITDGFWRISFTLGGSTPNFTFAVVLGLLTV